MIKEACVGSLNEALKAEVKGANQIELCSRLDLDGLSPEVQLVEEVLSRLNIHVKVMVRSREGDFIYSDKEMEEMVHTVEEFKSIGVKEIVFGALTSDNHIDMKALERITSAALPMKVTFHKAIDLLDNPVDGVLQLMKAPGITSILSSGGKPTAEEGAATLREMYATVKGKIQIIAAGKITHINCSHIEALTGVEAFHGKLIVGPLK